MGFIDALIKERYIGNKDKWRTGADDWLDNVRIIRDEKLEKHFLGRLIEVLMFLGFMPVILYSFIFDGIVGVLIGSLIYLIFIQMIKKLIFFLWQSKE